MRRYIAVLAACAAALFVAAEDRSAEETKAIDAVVQLGGKITVDEDAPGKPVVGVSLKRCRITAADLACLEELPKLRELDLTLTDVTDAGLEHLNGLTNLQTLDLYGCGKV